MPKWALVLIIFLLFAIFAGVKKVDNEQPQYRPITTKTYSSYEDCLNDPAAIYCEER